MTHRTRRFDQYHREFLVINLNRRWDQYSSIRSEKKRLQPGETVLRRRWLSRTSFPNRLATLRRSKVRQILKNFGSTSINVYGGRDESGAESFQSGASETPAHDPINNAAMPKVLESESNRLTISTRPPQARAISGTMALALALLFVMAALGTAFLLLQ
jgi:hypothetical protein